MPTITRFYGITIMLYFHIREHEPPHFHAMYGEEEELITICTGEVLKGHLPRRAHKMVIEWWDEHRSELLEIWNTQKFRTLPPLP